MSSNIVPRNHSSPLLFAAKMDKKYENDMGSQNPANTSAHRQTQNKSPSTTASTGTHFVQPTEQPAANLYKPYPQAAQACHIEPGKPQHHEPSSEDGKPTPCSSPSPPSTKSKYLPKVNNINTRLPMIPGQQNKHKNNKNSPLG